MISLDARRLERGTGNGSVRGFLRRLWGGEAVDRPARLVLPPGSEGPPGGSVPEIIAAGRSLARRIAEGEPQDFVPSLCADPGGDFQAEAFSLDGLPPLPLRPSPEAPLDSATAAPIEEGLSGRILRMVEAFRREAPGFWIRPPPVAAPLDAARRIFGEERILPAIAQERPALSRLLDRIADFTVAFLTAFRARAGLRFSGVTDPPLWAPAEIGVAVADDSAALISPAQWDELCAPRLARISRAAGGIFIHNCSPMGRRLAAYGVLPGLRGVDAPVPAEGAARVFEALGEGAVVHPRGASDPDGLAERFPRVRFFFTA